MDTSLAPSPMARVMLSFTLVLTSLTTSAFCRGDTLRRGREGGGREGGREGGSGGGREGGREGRERQQEGVRGKKKIQKNILKELHMYAFAPATDDRLARECKGQELILHSRADCMCQRL